MMNGLIPIFIFVSGVSFGFIIGVNSSRDVAADETLVCSCEQTSSSRVVPGTRRRPPAPSGIRGRLPLNDPYGLVTAGIAEESDPQYTPI